MPQSASDVAAEAAIKYPLSAVTYELLNVDESAPDAVTKLPAIIRLDADLTKRLANVSQGDLPPQTPSVLGNLEEAIAKIGFRRVHSAALLIALMKALPLDTRVFDYLDFWRYSIATGYLATLLANTRRVEHGGHAYAAGLFHDTGRLILEEHDSAGLSIVRSIQLRGDIPWHEVERSAFGFTALDLSVALARAWRLPQPLIDAISGLAQGERGGLSEALREGLLAARSLGFATSTGRREGLSAATAALIDRYYEGPDGLRRRVNGVLESSTIAVA